MATIWNIHVFGYIFYYIYENNQDKHNKLKRGKERMKTHRNINKWYFDNDIITQDEYIEEELNNERI